MSQFVNRVVLITGASSGIGAATAVEFARQGATLSLTGRNADRLQEVAAKCQAQGLSKDKILQLVADVKIDADLERVVTKTIETFKDLHVLVNSAGILRMGSFQDTTAEMFDELYRVNQRAPTLLTKAALPHLKRSKGSIVNVSSSTSHRPFFSMTAYNMMKAALDMLTKNLSVELGPDGVRVNAVNPGEIKTGMLALAGVKEEDQDEYFAAASKCYPLGRVGEASEVASAIAFLASDAASFITGVTLDVDGGVSQTASWTPLEWSGQI